MSSKRSHSLFFKIAVLFFTAAVSSFIVAAVSGRILYSNEERPRFILRKFVEEMNSLVLAEVRRDPSKNGLQSFSRLHPNVLFSLWKGKTKVFSNFPKDDEPNPELFETLDSDKGTIIKKIMNQYLSVVKADEFKCLIAYDFHPPSTLVVKTFVLLIVLIGVIFFVTYKFVAYLLSPVKELAAATEEVAGGNLRFRLESATSTEFGAVFKSFNNMTEHLETLFVNNTLLLGNVSHDLKFYLTRLRMTAEVEILDSEVRASVIEDIEGVTKLLERSLEAAKLGSKKVHYKLQPVCLSELLSKTIAGTNSPEKTLKATILKATIAPDVFAQADSQYFAVLLHNLYDNALKHGTEPEVTLSADSGEFVLAWKNRPAQPLSQSDLPFLSQPFFQGEKGRNKENHGAGLGLFIVRQIAEAHLFSFVVSLENDWFEVRISGPCALPDDRSGRPAG